MANFGQRQVARAALDTDAIPIDVDASPVALAVSPDAVWVVGRTQGGGRLARIDALTNEVGPTVPLPHPPTGLAVTRDGRTAWVATPPIGPSVASTPAAAARPSGSRSNTAPTRWCSAPTPSG